MMKFNSWIVLTAGCLSMISAFSASAKEVTASSLEVGLFYSCSENKFYASDATEKPDYELSVYSSSLQAPFNQISPANFLKSSGITYDLDNDGNLVLMKSGLLGLTKSVVTLGKPDPTDAMKLCSLGVVADAQGLFTDNQVPINIASSLVVNQDIELSDSCSAHSQWPNGGAPDYYRQYSDTVTLTDSGTKQSIQLKLSSSVSFSDQSSCEGANLP